jgi:hypothetical protein
VQYVDDLFITGGDNQRIAWLKQQLSCQFDITNLGHVSRYLGVEFNPLPNLIFPSQHDYVLDMLSDLGMSHYRPENIPLSPCLLLLSNMNSAPMDPYSTPRLLANLSSLLRLAPALLTPSIASVFTWPILKSPISKLSIIFSAM